METKEFKGTKGEWTINHWAKGECGATYNGESNGVTHYTGDNVGREVYNIVSDIHPNSHSIEHSFEGAHIAEIVARSEESLANAQLIAAAPEILKELIDFCKTFESTIGYQGYDHNVFVALNDRYIKSKKAIKKALGL